MAEIQSVPQSSRKIGDGITVIDRFGGYNRIAWIGNIVKITKKFITVKHELGAEYRFHSATGYIVGYSFPSNEYAIAPQNSR